VAVIYGKGGGQFYDAIHFDVDGNADGVAAADFNRDGRVDVACGVEIRPSPGPPTAGADVLIRMTGPRFNPPRLTPIAGSATSIINHVVAADFDGDGAPDLVENYAAEPGYPRMALLHGLGDGSFSRGNDIAGEALAYMTPVDLDGDGRLDVVGSANNGDIGALINANGRLAPGQFQSVVGKYSWSGVAAADVDGDGRVDLLTTRLLGGKLDAVTMHGNGDGTFGAPRFFANGVTAKRDQVAVAAADFDDDGISDFAFMEIGTGTLSIMRGYGDGTLSAGLALPTGLDTEAMVAGDFNGDGLPDLAIVDLGLQFQVVIFLNTSGH
jgi:hypothetical protein